MEPEVARGLRLPETSRAFLVEAGLPLDVGLRGRGFDLSGPALRRLEHSPSLVRLSKETPWNPPICLDEAAAGRVVQVRMDPRDSAVSFLNSSVEQHAQFWLAWRALMISRGGRSDSLTATLLRKAFGAIDRAALARDENPWSVLVREVEMGAG
jgi:hypothetical protein